MATYTFESGPHEARADYVTRQLIEFNSSNVVQDVPPQPIAIYALDAQGSVVGGLTGRTTYGWLEVSLIWVREELRGRGIGAELLRRAEEEARRQGCFAARLSSWDFQAPSFYARLGYVPYGRLEDYPLGHTVHYLRKNLAEASTGAQVCDHASPIC